MPTIFETCKPRADVQAGTTKDEQFAADLAQVVNGTAPKEYADPATFFRYTYPTRGLQKLIETVCKRLSGNGGELASIIRLDTQFGGGKTHSLIALTHAVRGMKGVENRAEFVDVALLPKEEVKVAALDGENADPSNGLLAPDAGYAAGRPSYAAGRHLRRPVREPRVPRSGQYALRAAGPGDGGRRALGRC